MAENDFRVGPGKGWLEATGKGKCADCKLLDTTSKDTFPDGMVRQGRCTKMPMQPNGRWDGDTCVLMEDGPDGAINEIGEKVKRFAFRQKE